MERITRYEWRCDVNALANVPRRQPENSPHCVLDARASYRTLRTLKIFLREQKHWTIRCWVMDVFLPCSKSELGRQFRFWGQKKTPNHNGPIARRTKNFEVQNKIESFRRLFSSSPYFGSLGDSKKKNEMTTTPLRLRNESRQNRCSNVLRNSRVVQKPDTKVKKELKTWQIGRKSMNFFSPHLTAHTPVRIACVNFSEV